MAKKRGRARRIGLHLTRARAARLFHMVRVLADAPRSRQEILSRLGIGLRTFYREIELLKRAGIRIRFVRKRYELRTTLEEVETRLPFPDPQVTFAEMKELAECSGTAARRLAALYHDVISAALAEPPIQRRAGRGRRT